MNRYTIKAVMRFFIDADSPSDAIDVSMVATSNHEHLEGVEYDGGMFSIVNENEPLAKTDMTIDEWLEYGWRHGWCSPVVCETHDGLPMSDAESDEMNEGDPCLHILRIYESPEHKAAIEADHAPSNWRASNQGWKS